MKNSCSSVSKLLEKYFDREVTGEERSLVEGHLGDCPACQEALERMEELGEAIRGPVEEAAEKENFQWVWQKIEREIRAKESVSGWESLRLWLDLSPLFKKRVWIPAVAMAMLILVTVPFFFKKTPSLPGPSVVEYIESQTFNVMVYESEKAKVTVIWLFEEPEKGSSTS